jgi:dTDP-4-dehydrorhamnose reductase
MLGHQLYKSFKEHFDTWVTARSSFGRYQKYGIFDPSKFISGIDVLDTDSLMDAFRKAKPDVVINSVGIIKQLPTAKDPLVVLPINALLPHRLARLCQIAGSRLIHMSTDCVFSGKRGMYTEEDIPDAEDLYGRSKLLGEVSEPHCLTIRSSIIGRELESRSGLIDWFLSQKGSTVKGYTQAYYTGFTTLEMARIMISMIKEHPNLHGVHQVSSERINKYDLLHLVKKAFDVDIQIEPYEDFKIDRSLDSTKFRALTGYKPPSWEQQICELASESAPYYS